MIVEVLGPTIAQIRIILGVCKIVIAIVEAILNIIKGLIQAFKNLLKWLPGMNLVSGAVEKVVGVLKDAVNFIKNFGQNVNRVLSKIGETGAEKVQRLSDEIAESQEKIYDARTKSNTLKPLLEEYQELSAKANKSADDLERMKEITSEIGQTDESLVKANGNLDIEKLKASVKEVDEIVAKGIKENMDKATEA